MPEDFTIETLLGKHPSRPFNKNIADIFFKAGFIEAWGRGIAKITNGFKNEGLIIPVFETTMGGIMVTINRPVYNKNTHTKGNDTGNVPDNVPGNVPDNVPGNVPGNDTDNDTDNRLTLILELIKKNQQILLKDLAKTLEVSTRTIRRDIEKLKKMNKLKRIGAEKGGHWKILDKQHNSKRRKR